MSTRLETTSHWVQIVTGVVLILGAVLVVAEMRQTKNLARAQLTSDSWGMGLGSNQAMVGDNAMSSYSKLCNKDQVLTAEDAMIISNTFIQRLSVIMRAKEIEYLGGFEHDGWKRAAALSLPFIFAAEHGKNWWKSATKYGFVDEGVAEFGEQLLSTIGPPRWFRGATAILDADVEKHEHQPAT